MNISIRSIVAWRTEECFANELLRGPTVRLWRFVKEGLPMPQTHETKLHFVKEGLA